MPGNIARRFTKIQYDDPEDNDIIGRACVSSEEHTIYHILRSLISNVEVIAILPSVLQLNADTDVVNGELSRTLQEHLMLEQKLGMLEDHRLPDGENDLTQLEKNIKSSLRNLLRLLKAHPLLLSSWKKELGKEMGKCERALIKELNILAGLEPKPLLTAPKPLAVSFDLKDSALVQDVSATIEEVTTKISQKHQEIATLQSYLQKNKEEESALEEQLQTSIEQYEIIQNKLQQEVDHMTAQVNEVLYRNFEEEAALRRKIKRVDAITEHFIDDFDQEMEALQVYTAFDERMNVNKTGRFTKFRYDDPEDNDVIGRAYISSEEHTINCILRNLISNVEFIAILPGVLQLNSESDVVDGELNRALQEHLMLEQRLEMLEDHGLVTDGRKESIQLEKKIRSSLRNLLRLLKARPLLLSAWKNELGKEIGICERALIKELKIIGGLDPKPLLTAAKPVSSDLKTSALEDFTAKMLKVAAAITQKHQEIAAFQSFLRKKRDEDSMLEELLQTSIEESETMQNQLQQEMDQKSTQLNDLMDNNFKEESAIRWKTKRVDRVTERIIRDFDEEIEVLQNNFETITYEYEQEVEEVKQMEMLYNELNVEYKYILEKRRLEVEKEEKKAKELVLRTKAALTIQACWRGHCVRKALKEEKKAGKGNKGKKGKASKKKGKKGK